ncbi:MAG: nickel transporter [Sulfuricella sp.]|nr:nickel transporter [Sulfuricella sp.]
METLPHDWLPLLGLVFVLGIKHGFDPDHLATIDGLTRFNAADRRLARLCGFLFSLGHGVVVMAVAVSVGLLAAQWHAPEWLEDTGAWISIVFLLLLGALNLSAVLSTAPGQVVQPVGLKGRLLGRLQHTRHPALIALVGALFALSFDTLSQAALFSLTARGIGGWQYALLLGFTFMVGMMLTDGVNGLWISRLIRRSDQLACIVSRTMGLVVASLSLLVAGFGIAKYFSPAIDAWSDGKETALGFMLIAVVALSFLFAVRLARPAYATASLPENI